MKSALALVAMLALVGCAPAYSSTSTRTWFGFSVGVTNAPPPRVVYVQRPATVWVTGTSVYVVQDSPDDMFLYGGYWYVLTDGYWYRASRYDGPFVAVDVRRVPRPILTLPSKHWRHHPHGGPPGQNRGHKGYRS